jgi:hypothetical protein
MVADWSPGGDRQKPGGDPRDPVANAEWSGIAEPDLEFASLSVVEKRSITLAVSGLANGLKLMLQNGLSRDHLTEDRKVVSQVVQVARRDKALRVIRAGRRDSGIRHAELVRPSVSKLPETRVMENVWESVVPLPSSGRT